MIHSPTSTIRRLTFRALFFGLFAVTLTGCGKKDGDKAEGTISGTVKYDGKPLPGGQVSFLSEEAIAAKTPGAAALIEADGTYKIARVPVGTVKITVTGPTRSSDNKDKTIPIKIPEHYQDKAKSGLSYTVVAGAQTHDIELTSK